MKKDKIQTEIELMSELELGEVVSQKALSQRLSVSVGLINTLLKRISHKGLVKIKSAPYNRWAYYITPKGFSEKSRLVVEYLDTSLGFFREAREEYNHIFSRSKACGISKVVFIGSGELAEIALLSAGEQEVKVVGLVDAEVNDDHCHGIPVIKNLDDLDPDVGLILTSMRSPQETYDKIREEAQTAQIWHPDFLHISQGVTHHE